MCTGLEPLLVSGFGMTAGAASTAAAATALGGIGAGLAAKTLAPKAPTAASQPDPGIERAAAEAKAAQSAASKVSMTRRAMRENSLLTGAGESLGAPAAGSPTGAGRATLGV